MVHMNTLNIKPFIQWNANGYPMPRVGFNLTEKTAKRIRQFAVKKTGSMKGLSQIGEEAIIEYLEKHEAELEKSENP